MQLITLHTLTANGQPNVQAKLFFPGQIQGEIKAVDVGTSFYYLELSNPKLINWVVSENITTFEQLISTNQTTITNIDEVVDGTTYIGRATPGTLNTDPLWSIELILVVAGITTIRWAEGNSNAVNIWNNRASLIYS